MRIHLALIEIRYMTNDYDSCKNMTMYLVPVLIKTRKETADNNGTAGKLPTNILTFYSV
jgi:hypothetical protein